MLNYLWISKNLSRYEISDNKQNCVRVLPWCYHPPSWWPRGWRGSRPAGLVGCNQSQLSIAASGPITAQYSPAVHGDGREAVAPRGAAQSPRVGRAPELEAEVAEDVRHAHGRGRQLRGPGGECIWRTNAHDTMNKYRPYYTLNTDFIVLKLCSSSGTNHKNSTLKQHYHHHAASNCYIKKFWISTVKRFQIYLGGTDVWILNKIKISNYFFLITLNRFIVYL